MRGHRPGKTGGVFAGIHRGFFRAENDADGRGSFAAVERSMSDRLLGSRLALKTVTREAYLVNRETCGKGNGSTGETRTNLFSDQSRLSSASPFSRSSHVTRANHELCSVLPDRFVANLEQVPVPEQHPRVISKPLTAYR
jgi:hypothetical protein